MFGKKKIKALEDEVLQLQSQLSQLSMELNLKVSKDGVVSAINVSPEMIRINSDKIVIDGETIISDNTLERFKDKGANFEITKEKLIEALEQISPNLIYE